MRAALRHHALARLCVQAYGRATHSVNEVEALVEDRVTETWIAFRGTERIGKSWRNWLDWLRDVRILPWRSRFGWSHAGMWKGAREWCEAHELDMSKPIRLTGHSLGAGVAVHAAMILSSQGYHVAELVTFGEPRSLFGSARKTLRGMSLSMTSYRLNGDLVTRLPPWGSQCVKQTPLKLYSAKGMESHQMVNYAAALTMGCVNG